MVTEDGIFVKFQGIVVLVQNLRSDSHGLFVLNSEIDSVEKGGACRRCGKYFKHDSRLELHIRYEHPY